MAIPTHQYTVSFQVIRTGVRSTTLVQARNDRHAAALVRESHGNVRVFSIRKGAHL